MIQPNLRPISQFDGPDAATRRLSQFEGNVKQALDNIAKQAAPLLKPTNLKDSAYVAGLDELVPCAGTFQVTLPAATFNNAGRSVGVVVRSGTVTVVPVAGLVQGAASDALATVGMRLYVSDGVGWWRAP